VTRVHFRIAITIALILALACIWRLEKARVSASAMQNNRATAVRAQLSETVSVYAARRGFPYVNLSDGRELLASFDSDSAAASMSAAQADRLAPLAMTSADLDADGVADLICSYDSPQGAFIAVYRGNVDAIFPNSPQARQRRANAEFTDAPFLAPAHLFAVPVAGELMVAGDANGDGRQDIVITSRASRSLYVMAGDGKGSIHLAKEVALPGTVTALAAGDVNRRDGLIDILVGVVSDSGPRALVFEGPRGALNAEPEVFALPAAASDFAIGQFDNDPAADIAVAAGRSLLLIYGRDRKLTGDASSRADVKQATTSTRDFSYGIRAMTSGKFSDGPGLLSDIGLLADDGAIYVLRVKDQKPSKAKKRAPKWTTEKLSATAQANATRLLTAHVSSLPADTLLLLDGGGHQLRIIETGTAKTSTALANRNATVDLDVDGEAIAALPMRLNIDALDDLVILRRGASAPAIMTSAPAAIFSVDNTGDNGGVNPAPGAGTGTLRQAIVDSNATAGADTILFNIGLGVRTINLAAPLPAITDAGTIDGTVPPSLNISSLQTMSPSSAQTIELSGVGAGAGANGLTLQTVSNVTVRGLVLNLFSGNGISIIGGNGNFIEGNFIGMDAVGAMALPNGLNGVRVQDSPNNTIGGATAAASNLISGNTGAGVLLISSGTTGNQIQGNLIGTDINGLTDMGNGTSGVQLDGVTNNTIGGTAAGARNIISGNNGGILIRLSSSGNQVRGNFIGTDVTGNNALGNDNDGVLVQDSTNNTIGGTVAGTSNVLSGNGSNGLEITGGSNNAVQNNFIGTDRTGTAALGNTLNGVAIGSSTNNTIGSTRNLISGNGASGIVLATSANGNNIQGNFIGIDIDAAGAIGNTGPGITVFDSSNVTITGNIISGNGGDGVHLENTAPGGQNNAVRGNFIGTDSIGTTAVPNTGNGVGIVSMPGNTIGGTTVADRNLISGNGAGGVGISGDAGTNNTVTGNFIGTDVNGTAALANSGSGVSISTGPNNVVGGTVAGSGNLLSGNLSSGVFIQDGAAGTLVQGNLIGTNAAGTAGVPNANGVVCTNGATGVTVGGTTAGAGNTIAFNTFFGVFVNSGTAHSNAILGNSIFSNGSLGIGLSDDAVTANDPCDADAGPNDLQNFPLITAVISGGMPTVQGTLNSTANTTFRLEFFKNTTCDVSGNGQGQTFIGSTNVATDGACNAAFNVMLPVALAAGDVVTATATDSANNTSEFSPCFTAPAATNADLSVALSAMPNPVSAGNDLTFMAQVANAGPDPAANVTLTEAVPANTTFQSLSAPPGWSCSTPGVGGTGTITCTNPSLASGASAMFTLVVKVNPGTPGGTVINSTATVDSSTPDPNPSNNSGTAMATVAGGSCTITCPADVTANSSAAQCGANVDYPPPMLNGSCGPVTCAPAAGSFFPRGSTNVKCTVGGGPSCSFVVTVVDNTPPAIACPPSITVGTAPGKNVATVDYPIATATDACGVANVVCLPPSGSTFPLGASTVNCSARDVANNTANCSFTVTVNDVDAPVIRCPNNITMELPPTQTSAVVTYPLPTVVDNLPGVTVTCAPPSGAIFPLGVTAVVCVAVDTAGNRSTCGFSISLVGGPPLLEVIIPTGKPALEFGTDRPVSVKRKNKNRASGPCAAFTVVNRSFSRLDLTLDTIRRIGSDVDSGHITDAKEGDTYSLSVVNANGLETPLDIGDTASLPVGGQVNFCLRFSPVLPPVVGSNTQLSAPQAIPDLINSRVTFRVAGGSTLAVNVNAIVETALHLINPNNPKKAATLRFTKSGDEFSVTFAVHDANNDVSRARYEFLDAGGAVIAGPFEVDLTQAIQGRNLVRGQSFTVTQRFTGANSNRNAVAVRVTVFDGETNVTSPIVVLDTATANATDQAASSLRFTPVTPPAVRMNSPLP
jgi:parallel beta-helix repeat protein